MVSNGRNRCRHLHRNLLRHLLCQELHAAWLSKGASWIIIQSSRNPWIRQSSIIHSASFIILIIIISIIINIIIIPPSSSSQSSSFIIIIHHSQFIINIIIIIISIIIIRHHHHQASVIISHHQSSFIITVDGSEIPHQLRLGWQSIWVYPNVYDVFFYILGGAGFIPSTVSSIIICCFESLSSLKHLKLTVRTWEMDFWNRSRSFWDPPYLQLRC